MKLNKFLIFLQRIWDFIGFPLRVFLAEETKKKLHLTTLAEERFNAVKPFLHGRVIDIGCGRNELMIDYRKKGNEGIGVDVFNFGGADIIVDTVNMPFKSSKFDTACLIACLNHIPKSNREKVLSEIYRLLKDEGRLIVTMLSPFVGNLCHKLVWWDWDRKERGIHEGEDYGLSNSYVIKLITEQKFNGIFFV